jgi:hypothetical protein
MELPLLADVAALAEKVGVPADNAAVRRAVDRASHRFRGAVRCPVSRVDDDTIRLDGHGGRVLVLPAVPVVAVTTVRVAGTPVTDFTWSRNGMLRRTAGWPDDFGNVDVVCSHGYLAEEIPGEVFDVVLEMAEWIYDTSPGVVSRTVGGQSTSWANTGGVTAAWTAAVNNFRINVGDRA